MNLERFIAAGDEEMIDSLASRIVTRYGRRGNAPKLLEEADKLADYYAALAELEAVVGSPRDYHYRNISSTIIPKRCAPRLD